MAGIEDDRRLGAVQRITQGLLRQPPLEAPANEPDVARRVRRQVRALNRRMAWAQAYVAWLEFCLARVDDLMARGWTEITEGACSSCGRHVVSASDAEGVVGRMAMSCPAHHVIHLHCLVAIDDGHLATCPCCWGTITS